MKIGDCVVTPLGTGFVRRIGYYGIAVMVDIDGNENPVVMNVTQVFSLEDQCLKQSTARFCATANDKNG